MHTKSDMVRQLANKMGFAYIDIKLSEEPCSIQKQIQGLPITNQEHKIEYQIKSQTGRIVMSFDNEERAREEAISHGLNCFRVTTITEKL